MVANRPRRLHPDPPCPKPTLTGLDPHPAGLGPSSREIWKDFAFLDGLELRFPFLWRLLYNSLGLIPISHHLIHDGLHFIFAARGWSHVA